MVKRILSKQSETNILVIVKEQKTSCHHIVRNFRTYLYVKLKLSLLAHTVIGVLQQLYVEELSLCKEAKAKQPR